MKYLVIGDANSMHIYNFTRNFLLPRGYEVHLLTLSTNPVRDSYVDFYNKNGVTLHSIANKNYKGLNKRTRFWRIVNLIRKNRLMHEVPKVDICHLQSVYKTSVMMILRNRRKYDKLIFSYWGGDLENCTRSIVRLTEKGLKLTDVITVTVKSFLDEFRKVYGTGYDSKIYISRLATSGIDCINTIKKNMTLDECRENYCVPKGKIVVTCGYSAYREQHQERILQEIGKLPKEIKDKLFVFVPMQYGRMEDTEYLKSVKKAKECADFQCVILNEYVPFEKSAQLAVITDIYLHLRDTDAFSNALKEHVYASSYIIKGDWLKYYELEDMNAPVVSISSFDKLAETLESVLENYQIPQEIRLFDSMFQLYSTEKINEQWAHILDKVQ